MLADMKFFFRGHLSTISTPQGIARIRLLIFNWCCAGDPLSGSGELFDRPKKKIGKLWNVRCASTMRTHQPGIEHLCTCLKPWAITSRMEFRISRAMSDSMAWNCLVLAFSQPTRADSGQSLSAFTPQYSHKLSLVQRL